MEKAVFNLNRSLKLLVDRIEFKLKANKQLLLNSTNNYVSGDFTNPAVIFTERICLEAVLDPADTLLQLITAPILLTNYQNYFLQNIQTSRQPGSATSDLATFNTLYVTSIQLRHQAFYNQQICYSNISEFVAGDVFGSIDQACAFDLVALLTALAQCFPVLVFNKFVYRSIKLRTSLTSLNLVGLCGAVEDSRIRTGLISLTVSPISFADCDFHEEALHLEVADIDLRVMCSLSPRYSNAETQKSDYFIILTVRTWVSKVHAI